jgi:5'-phosphate synthase pdxT subunit
MPVAVGEIAEVAEVAVRGHPGGSSGAMSVVIGVLALQGDVREHLSALESAGAQAVPVRRERELDTVDGLVIPGGESTTMDKLVRAFDLLEPIRQRVKEGMPAYGSCAGMIMLADTLVDAIEGQQTIGGIDMAVRRNAFGRQVDSFEADLAIHALPEEDRPLRAVFIRAPWVEAVGRDVDVIATIARQEAAPGGGTRIVAVRQGPLLATAFHPELTGDLRVHRYFVDLVRAGTDGMQVGESAKDSLMASEGEPRRGSLLGWPESYEVG